MTGLAFPLAVWLAAASYAPVVQADRVVVIKSERLLVLEREGAVLASYEVALGRNPRGAKTMAGDGRTPEGSYLLDWRNDESRFHRSIHVSYPGPVDRGHARTLGVSPGGAIMIHGLPETMEELGRGHLASDWTDGCIAVTNEEMDEIWERVEDGTPIEIRP